MFLAHVSRIQIWIDFSETSETRPPGLSMEYPRTSLAYYHKTLTFHSLNYCLTIICRPYRTPTIRPTALNISEQQDIELTLIGPVTVMLWV
jgi:hypothetical protein